MLDTQCSPKTPSSKEGFEHAQSCVLIIELPADQQSNGHVQKRFESSCVRRKNNHTVIVLQNTYSSVIFDIWFNVNYFTSAFSEIFCKCPIPRQLN